MFKHETRDHHFDGDWGRKNCKKENYTIKKTKIRFAFLESFQILYKLYGREINKKHSKNDQNEVLENLPPLPNEIKCSAS